MNYRTSLLLLFLLSFQISFSELKSSDHPSLFSKVDSFLTDRNIVVDVLNDSSIPNIRIDLQLWGLGSYFDPLKKKGLSNLLAQMIEKSCNYSKDSYKERLNALGTTIKVISKEHYILVRVETLTKHKIKSLEILSYMLDRLYISPSLFSLIKDQSIQQLKSDFSNDIKVASYYLKQHLYKTGHPFSYNHKGNLKNIKNISFFDILSSWKSFREKGSLRIQYVGDLSFREAANLTDKYFANLSRFSWGYKSFAKIPEDIFSKTLEGAKSKILLLDRPGRTQATILYALKLSKTTSDNFLPLSMGIDVFGGSFSARLMREIRVKRGWAYGAYAGLSQKLDENILVVNTKPQTQNAVRTLSLIKNLISDLLDNGISSQEFSFIKTKNINELSFLSENSEQTMFLYNQNIIESKPLSYYDTLSDVIEGVTISNINDALKTSLQDSQSLIVVVADLKKLEVDELKNSLPGYSIKTIKLLEAE